MKNFKKKKKKRGRILSLSKKIKTFSFSLSVLNSHMCVCVKRQIIARIIIYRLETHFRTEHVHSGHAVCQEISNKGMQIICRERFCLVLRWPSSSPPPRLGTVSPPPPESVTLRQEWQWASVVPASRCNFHLHRVMMKQVMTKVKKRDKIFRNNDWQRGGYFSLKTKPETQRTWSSLHSWALKRKSQLSLSSKTYDPLVLAGWKVFEKELSRKTNGLRCSASIFKFSLMFKMSRDYSERGEADEAAFLQQNFQMPKLYQTFNELHGAMTSYARL